MDKFDFMTVVADTFEPCKSYQEIENRFLAMHEILKQQCELSKQYLDAGVLNNKEEEQ